jgi:pyruvate/2-oxoglutarate/acetoin dehydrogenase E1 component
MFAHIPGLKVVMPATVTDAHDLLLASVRDPGPVLFVENRRLYGTRGRLGDSPLPLGQARVVSSGQEVTVVTLERAMLPMAQEIAAVAHGLVAES